MLILVTMIFVFAFSSLACASVQMGMKGSVVQSVQYMLQDAGYLSGSADGDFGSQTQQAVVQFQTDHGLSADGIVGSQTMEALSEASGRPVPEEAASATEGHQRRLVMELRLIRLKMAAAAVTLQPASISNVVWLPLTRRLFPSALSFTSKVTAMPLPLIPVERLSVTVLTWPWILLVKPLISAVKTSSFMY